MKTFFLFVFLFSLPVSSFAQTGSNSVLVGTVNLGIGRSNEVKAWGEDYIYGKTDNDFFSTLGLVSRNGSTAWSHGFDWSYFNTNSIAVASSSYAIFALMDTIYKVDRQGNVQRVKTPSVANNFCLYKGENGRYLLTIPDWDDPVFKFYVYDENLNYHGEIVGASAGGVRRIIEKSGYYYVATQQYGGGTYSNVSSNFDKYDTSGTLIWTFKAPNATRPDLVLVNDRLYFSCMFARLSDPSLVIRYGELSLATGDTLWSKQWIAYGFPMGVRSSAHPINSFPFPNGQGFVIVGQSTKPGQSNENFNIATALLISLEGEVSSVILDSSFGIFNAGDWNSGRELVLSASGSSIGSTKLSFYHVPGITVGIDDEGEVNPSDFTLSQNYPNPFNPSTSIRFSLSAPEKVTLKVYDLIGQEVATLVDEFLDAGMHEVEFNGHNLTSGNYFYALTAGDKREVKKMVLLK